MRRGWSLRTPLVRACVRASRPKKSATTPALFEINRPSGGGKADPQFEALSRGPHLAAESSILKEPVRTQKLEAKPPRGAATAWRSHGLEAKPPRGAATAWRSHGLSAAKDGDRAQRRSTSERSEGVRRADHASSARSALRTLMNPHDARAETHTLCQGRRPPAHGSDDFTH